MVTITSIGPIFRVFFWLNWNDRNHQTTPDNYCFITMVRKLLSTHQFWPVINLFDWAPNYSHKQHQRLSNDRLNSQWTHNSLASDFISFIDLKKKIDKWFWGISKTKTEIWFKQIDQCQQLNWYLSNSFVQFENVSKYYQSYYVIHFRWFSLCLMFHLSLLAYLLFFSSSFLWLIKLIKLVLRISFQDWVFY